MAPRDLSSDELRLVDALLRKAKLNSLTSEWLSRVKAEALSDGGMGSIRFRFYSGEETERKFGRCAAELQFNDSDGTPILVSLNLDKDDRPYELDIWKANFQPVIAIPMELQ